MKRIKRIALVSFVALVAVFITGPVFYGVGSMLIDEWRDILPYYMTHSAGGCSYHGLHHGHHRIILEQK